MLTMFKRFEFEAAHQLPKHPGKCKFLHGHRYELEIGVSGEIDPRTGMIADFKNLKTLVQEQIIDPLDHSYLNEVAGFPGECPTADNTVQWIVDRLQARIKATGCELAVVRLWETSGAWMEWKA